MVNKTKKVNKIRKLKDTSRQQVNKMMKTLKKGHHKSPLFDYYHYGKNTQVKQKVLFVTVGPPARGKSFFGNSIIELYPKISKIFNSGSKRREKGYQSSPASFFATKKGKALLNEWAMETLGEACEWLEQSKENKYAIFDATNTVVKRRQEIYEYTKNKSNISTVYVEMLCPNELVIHCNMLSKILTSPDYTNMIESSVKKNKGIEIAIKDALNDIKKRNANYLKVYKILTNKEKSRYNYVQVIVPSCTDPPSSGVIVSNLNKNSWIVKYIETIPRNIISKTLKGYSSYKH